MVYDRLRLFGQMSIFKKSNSFILYTFIVNPMNVFKAIYGQSMTVFLLSASLRQLEAGV